MVLPWCSASLDIKDYPGHTPLMWAVKDGRRDVVELLLAKGADAAAKTW
jgi:ankyrin repeat protein